MRESAFNSDLWQRGKAFTDSEICSIFGCNKYDLGRLRKMYKFPQVKEAYRQRVAKKQIIEWLDKQTIKREIFPLLNWKEFVEKYGIPKEERADGD